MKSLAVAFLLLFTLSHLSFAQGVIIQGSDDSGIAQAQIAQSRGDAERAKRMAAGKALEDAAQVKHHEAVVKAASVYWLAKARADKQLVEDLSRALKAASEVGNSADVTNIEEAITRASAAEKEDRDAAASGLVFSASAGRDGKSPARNSWTLVAGMTAKQVDEAIHRRPESRRAGAENSNVVQSVSTDGSKVIQWRIYNAGAPRVYITATFDATGNMIDFLEEQREY